MSNKTRVVIAEDHTLLRAGLRIMLSQEPDMEVVGEADNGKDAIRLAGTLDPDLVLMDLTMPGTNGMEATAEIKRRHSTVRVLVLTIHKTDEYIQEALRAGADGYVLKDASQDELRTAIRTVLNGKSFLSPDVSEKVINGYLAGGDIAHTGTAGDRLTLREREVLKLVAEGHGNKHIAGYLCLSIKTVEKHRSNMMKKLGLHSTAGVTAYAIEKGLVQT
jgi:DNA-binding NarL/FixJ family response regulator